MRYKLEVVRHPARVAFCVVTNVHLRQKHGQASGKNHPEQLEHSCPINISRFPLGPKITVNADYSLNVPDQVIIPVIEGDGTGADITPVMIKVVDAAVQKGLCGQAQDPLDGSLRRREGHQGLRPGRLAA